ncbi:MAG: 3-oxoacyl-[acyl-carrier-protein] synthase III C-terminal domain-containing protein, partial [Treponema sp.]|nr:3-oxoacyl-[acyl-carrier-protein] synthase III C-terminal domain-containing protein [Spirochaetales bacterium]MDY5811600.1 3-oxoacyl-[acyl-carrier-protein] synthase III C-terminal domain-containing protein [Treponema sp.]
LTGKSLVATLSLLIFSYDLQLEVNAVFLIIPHFYTSVGVLIYGVSSLLNSTYGTDGSGFGNIIVKNRAARSLKLTGKEDTDEQGNIRRDDYFYMNGESIFNFTIGRVPKLIEEILAKNNLQKDDIDYYVFHQANKFMLNTIRKICGIPKEKFYINLENTGNTTSSSIPIGLKDAIESGLIKEGNKVMIAGFGVGESWAGTVLQF